MKADRIKHRTNNNRKKKSALDHLIGLFHLSFKNEAPTDCSQFVWSPQIHLVAGSFSRVLLFRFLMCTHCIMHRSLLQMKCLSCSTTFQIRPWRLLSYTNDYFPSLHFPSDSIILPFQTGVFSDLFLEFLCCCHDPNSPIPFSIFFFNPFNIWRSLVLLSTIHSLLSLTIPSLFPQAYTAEPAIILTIPFVFALLLPLIVHWFILLELPFVKGSNDSCLARIQIPYSVLILYN